MTYNLTTTYATKSPMNKESCATCSSQKISNHCGICADKLCKSCSVFLSPEDFQYMMTPPPETEHPVYCSGCYATVMTEKIDLYNQNLEKAKQVAVFGKSQGKETRFIKRFELPIVITDGSDENDVTMRMAFRAVEMNYDALIDADVIPKKVRNGSYQTSTWSGIAIPVKLDRDKLMKDRSFSTDPN